MRWITTAILWIPRLLAMILAIMLAMFAVDVFLEGNDFWQTSEDFVTHLIPSFCVVIILVIGWRRDGLASIGFLVLGVAYFVALSGWKHIPETLALTLPPLGISLAFFARMQLLKPSRSEKSQ
ncbi:hypothetical protein KAH43_00440 [Candidatus Bipolaricaulota bacterium]|nr:hypothetical protein [Candidatus Bipolaricaulota bacterium]